MFDFLSIRPYSLVKSVNGFTLIEAMVMTFLALLVVTMAQQSYLNALDYAQDQKNNIISKTIASQIISTAIGRGSFVPRLVSGKGQVTIIYCYSASGGLVTNSFGASDSKIVLGPLAKGFSGHCDSAAKFEARLFLQSGTRLSLQVWGRTTNSAKSPVIPLTRREFDLPEGL